MPAATQRAAGFLRLPLFPLVISPYSFSQLFFPATPWFLRKIEVNWELQ